MNVFGYARGSSRKREDVVDGSIDLLSQQARVDPVAQSFEQSLMFRQDTVGSAQPVKWGACLVVATYYVCGASIPTNHFLFPQMQHRLKEVMIDPHLFIDWTLANLD